MSEFPHNEGRLLFKVNTGKGIVYYIGGAVESTPAGVPECLRDGIEGFIRITP